MPKRKQVAKSIEDIYCNKHFVPPKEKNLETIFEEPRQSKDGTPVLTSVKKYKRYLHFDPSQNKIQKRKQKAKKCLKKLKLNRPVTRSSPENSKSNDISLYMSDILGESSSDSDDMEVSFTSKGTPEIAADTTHISNINTATSDRSESLNELCETPKRNYYERRPSVLLQEDTDLVDTTDESEKNCEAEKSGNNNLQIDAKKTDGKNATETVESPRRSCCIS